jgi:hypothetical protein
MKKVIGSIMIVLALVCFTSIGYAAGPGDKSKPSQEAKLPPPAEPTCAVTLIGMVKSIDKTNNAVVVNDQYDKLNKTIYLTPDAIKNLKVGQTVSFELSAPARTENIKILKKEKAK